MSELEEILRSDLELLTKDYKKALKKNEKLQKQLETFIKVGEEERSKIAKAILYIENNKYRETNEYNDTEEQIVVEANNLLKILKGVSNE